MLTFGKTFIFSYEGVGHAESNINDFKQTVNVH
jgi:hypothetical protein